VTSGHHDNSDDTDPQSATTPRAASNTTQNATKVALITGVARRVGRATTLELARHGYDIVGTVRADDADSASLRREVEQLGRRCELLPIDLELPDADARIAAFALDRFGRVDAVVNNASLYEPDSPAGPTASLSRRLMWVNHDLPTQLVLRLADALRATAGAVVNLIDLQAERPMPGYAAYCATKAAFANATLSLARRLAPQVRVNGLSPGMIGPVKPDAQVDATAYLKRVPLARPGEFAEAAKVIRFLIAEATYMTGQIVRVDGGRSIVG
jgi:pteridine reductase